MLPQRSPAFFVDKPSAQTLNEHDDSEIYPEHFAADCDFRRGDARHRSELAMARPDSGLRICGFYSDHSRPNSDGRATVASIGTRSECPRQDLDLLQFACGTLHVRWCRCRPGFRDLVGTVGFSRRTWPRSRCFSGLLTCNRVCPLRRTCRLRRRRHDCLFYAPAALEGATTNGAALSKVVFQGSAPRPTTQRTGMTQYRQPRYAIAIPHTVSFGSRQTNILERRLQHADVRSCDCSCCRSKPFFC